MAAKLVFSKCTVRFRKRVESRSERQGPPLGMSSCQSEKQSNCKPRTSRQVSKAHAVAHKGEKVRLKPEPQQRLHSSVMAECNTEAKHILKYLTVNTEL